MRQSHNLRIIIPAHNEAERIEPTLHDYCETFADVATILVVANGCTDRTVSITRALQERYANLDLIAIAAPIGKGGAVRTGLWTGSEPYIGFVDADGSTSAGEYRRLFDALCASDHDALIGSRWLAASQIEPRQPLSRRIASRTFNAIVQGLFGLPFSDTQCGAKLFRRRAIGEIAHSLEIADFSFDIEVLWHLKRARFRVREEPTTWADRVRGSSVRLLSTSWTMLKSLVRLRVRESAFWVVPFVDRIGRKYVMPVVDRHRILVLGDAESFAKNDHHMASFFSALKDAGFHITGLETETRGTWFEKAWRSKGILGAAFTLLWYATSSSRRYDAIIDAIPSQRQFIPPITLKPSFVVAGALAFERNQRRTYQKSVFVDISHVGPESAAEIVELAVRGANPYAGVFLRREERVALHCPDENGDWQHHLLHH